MRLLHVQSSLRWRRPLLLGAAALGVGLAALAGLPALAEIYGDWRQDAPGVWHRITAADLPPPYAGKLVGKAPRAGTRPGGAEPKSLPGFKVEQFATGLSGARLLRTAPNGDVFLAASQEGRILVLRDLGPGVPARVSTFASGLDAPFGLAFYPPGPDPKYLYVGTVGAVLRFAYHNGDTRATGAPEGVVSELPEGGHWTRDVVFSADGRHMFVSVGSESNVEEGGANETLRANILQFNPDGGGMRRFATGLRNPVGMAIEPSTGDLWTAVNERDGLGDDLPPDYVTRVRPGAFYGWPWFYIGAHQDPRHEGAHPELRNRVAMPDVLIQPHSAPLQLAVYTGEQFPQEYRNDIFVALHGSWDRSERAGYKVIRLKLRDGAPTGGYEDFLTGFVTSKGDVWGRPVGIAVAADGSLLVSEDANGTVWRISYSGDR
jgi:glucose/arabinose dehydrogenase